MDWPASLPCVRFDPYQASQRPAALEIDWGLAIRRRQLYAKMKPEISCEVVLNGTQEAALRTFYNDTTEMGTLPFNIPVQADGYYGSRSATFIGDPPSYVPVSDTHVRASFNLLTVAA